MSVDIVYVRVILVYFLALVFKRNLSERSHFIFILQLDSKF